MSESHGAIILVIGMIIISAGAGVFVAKNLIDTKARAGNVAKENIAFSVGNTLNIIEVYARSEEPRTLDYIYVKVKLNAKSDPIPMHSVLLYINSGVEEGYYRYSKDMDCEIDPTSNRNESSMSNDTNTNSYGIYYTIRTSDDKSDDLLTDGDIAVICAKTPTTISDADYISIGVYPKLTQKSVIDFRTPDVFKGTYFKIYPPFGQIY